MASEGVQHNLLALGGLPNAVAIMEYPLETEPCGTMVYKYTDPRGLDVHIDHLRILYFRSNGLKAKEIANALHIELAVVQNVLRHGPNKRFLKAVIGRAWDSRFKGMQVLSDAFAEVAQGLVDDTKSDDPKVRARSREIYLKTLGNVFPLNVPNSGPDDDGPLNDGDIHDIDEVMNTTSSPLPADTEDFSDEGGFDEEQ